jgi:hypothetical protein
MALLGVNREFAMDSVALIIFSSLPSLFRAKLINCCLSLQQRV